MDPYDEATEELDLYFSLLTHFCFQKCMYAVVDVSLCSAYSLLLRL